MVNGFIANELANVRKFFGARYKENIGSQDGGVATGILKTLFNQDKIDCAVGVTRDENWETKVILRQMQKTLIKQREPNIPQTP